LKRHDIVPQRTDGVALSQLLAWLARPATIDQAKDRRRSEIERLHRSLGACAPGSGFDDLPNALRGRWTMSCEKGKREVAITLAPTIPPKVQMLEVRAAPSAPARAETCQ